MSISTAFFKPLLLSLACSVASYALAQDTEAPDRLDELFTELQDPEQEDWERVEEDIWREWSRSGSASIDLLLQRGREALEEQDIKSALEHLTALTDHAPDFAEGWNARATAFYQAEEFGMAIADIQRTLALNPRHFGALTGLASIFEQLGKPREALSAYRAVQTIHPHRPNVEDAIERLERELGDAAI